MKKISAKIIADSIDARGNRITSYILTYPRFIHSEMMTHRMFSRNAASSRAIPFEKMVKMVKEDPFIPIAWQKDHKGMQGTEYLIGDEALKANNAWVWNLKQAIDNAKFLNKSNVTKQLCNRLLEPFQWYTCLVTATEYDNFYELRCPQYCYMQEDTDKPLWFKSRKDFMDYDAKQLEQNKVCLEFDELGWRTINKSHAEIHIQALAEAMWDQMQSSKPKLLKSGEYHLPFIEIIED